MFGRHDAAEFATPEHFDLVEDSIKKMEEEWKFWDGDIPEYFYGMSPNLTKFTLEYLNMLRGIPNLPYFLIWNHSDAFCFHWKRPHIELIAQMFSDEDGVEPDGVSYLEFDKNKGPVQRKTIIDHVEPEDYDKILDRLNNPKFAYGDSDAR